MAELTKSSFDPILDSIADGVFTVDQDWKITSFNRAAENITGIPRNQAIGRKCWEVFHADVCEQSCLLKKTMKTKRQSINKTVHIVNTQGKSVPISISTALLKNNRGRVIGGVETFRDVSELEALRKEVSEKFTFEDIVTRDHSLQTMLETLPVIARSSSPVLISGESGTGKEVLAKALHHVSGRGKEPFIAVNCGALPENLLESELFGYKKGAFTDAKNDKPGRFDLAKKGTLFLDEIGELPKPLQVKLLRVLQEKVYEPLGGIEPVPTEARIIAASNRDLDAMVAEGTFRQDLYYRINVIPIHLPALRERRGDIPLLVDHFIGRFNVLFKRHIESITPDALQLLDRHPFPGNIRELENILQHAFVLSRGSIIDTYHLPVYLRESKTDEHIPARHPDSVAQFEKKRIMDALERNRYNRARTARELDMHVTTLWRKMRRYGIEG